MDIEEMNKALRALTEGWEEAGASVEEICGVLERKTWYYEARIEQKHEEEGEEP